MYVFIYHFESEMVGNSFVDFKIMYVFAYCFGSNENK